MYNQRDIVLVPFPYSDLTAIKKRPVLIISNNEYNSTHDDVVVCVVTSNLHTDDYSVELHNVNLEIGMLPEVSLVKIHKLFTIHKSKVLKKFSVVKQDYFQTVIYLLHKLTSLEIKKLTE